MLPVNSLFGHALPLPQSAQRHSEYALPDDPPPSAHDMLNEWTGLRAEFVGSFTFDPYYWNVVKGLFVKERLVAVPRANSGIGEYLGFAAERDATRILQFAVNTVICALTQEGSMTQRLMQIVH